MTEGGPGAKGKGLCAIEAKWVCRLVLPGVPVCSPSEEGIVGRGVGCPPVGLGMKGAGSKKLPVPGNPLGHP